MKRKWDYSMWVDRGPGEDAKGMFENISGQNILPSEIQAGLIHLANSCWAYWPGPEGGHKGETWHCLLEAAGMEERCINNAQ